MMWRACAARRGPDCRLCDWRCSLPLTLGNHWSLRPQLISYVSFALLLALLSYCFEGWEGKWQLPLARGSQATAGQVTPRLRRASANLSR